MTRPRDRDRACRHPDPASAATQAGVATFGMVETSAPEPPDAGTGPAAGAPPPSDMAWAGAGGPRAGGSLRFWLPLLATALLVAAGSGCAQDRADEAAPDRDDDAAVTREDDPTATPGADPTATPEDAAAARRQDDAARSREGGRLTWAPPPLTNPVTYHVSGKSPGTLVARPGQDSVVVFDGPVHRRLRMDGGRHWVIVGGEVDNDEKWSDRDDRSGLEFSNVTGTAFVEGVLIHGKHGKDGIRIAKGGSDTTLVVQNTRIVDRKAGRKGYHADVIQAFGGVEALKVDRLTGSGNYQGQMWKEESGTTFGPSDFRRVNYRASTPELEYMINFVMSSPTGPVTLHEVYNEPDPKFADGDFCRAQIPSESASCGTDEDGRKYVTWSDTPITVKGRITQGPPPGGDFVPEGVAGLDYESPGYR